MIIRELSREETKKVWEIDRSEAIEGVYSLREGNLVLESEHYDMKGWPPGEQELYTPILLDCFDRGGTFYGVFVGSDIIGAAVLESKFIGRAKNTLQLKFLHISRAYRRQGLGRTLFEKSVERARKAGAKKLYISATPSENTIDFYMRLGCVVTEEVDPDLLDLEPDDIHLEYTIP